jgi:hypothetical protein
MCREAHCDPPHVVRAQALLEMRRETQDFHDAMDPLEVKCWSYQIAFRIRRTEEFLPPSARVSQPIGTMAEFGSDKRRAAAGYFQR